MTALTFTQVQSLALYASSASGDAGIAGYWAGYVPGPDAAFGASATLAETWNDIGGTYLFLAATPDDLAAFTAALARWLPAFAPRLPPRFLWLSNPGDPAAYWQAIAWFASGEGAGSDVQWSSWGVGRFVLDRYDVTIAPGAAMTLVESEPAHMVFAAGAATFRGPGGAFGPAGTSALPLQGSRIGTWTGSLTVPADGLGALGVELRYAIRNALDPGDPRLRAVSMPVLGTATGIMTLDAAWDPLFPTARGRTEFRFGAASPSIAAAFVTQRGYDTTLTPAAATPPLWSGGLRFCRCATRIDAPSDRRSDLYSLAPDGAFMLTVAPPPGGAGPGMTDHLMLGLSGLESAALASAGTLILFEAGHPAFAPNVAADATVPGSGETLLTDLATTAWMTVLPPQAGANGLDYFAQPRQSPLFTGTGSAFMDFQEVPAARLPGWQDDGSLPPVYPVGAYAGVAATQTQAARALENAALAPRRRQLIAGPPPGIEAEGEDDVLAITPQGLVVTLPPDHSEISGAIIANLPDSPQPRLAFDSVGRDFEAAIFANQLFFVVSNVATFLDQASCEPPFALDLDGWRFRLDPNHWRTGDAPTLMVWKFANRSLESLAADTSCWGWQAAAKDENDSLQPTWRTLNAIIEAARRAAQPGGDPASPYARFYRDVVADPGWNGVLFLNAPVDLADLPPALRFVAAGLDPERFYAHHVGASVTPFDPTTVPITLKQTSVFGLIDYVDDVDLVPAATLAFQFKTMRLTARFANAHLSDFAAIVEISVNRLFSAPLIKEQSVRGNNLIISGALQKSSGAPAYAFSLTGENRYNARGSALTGIEVTSVRIETLSNPAPRTVSTSFALGGRLRFFTPPEFDLFGYGPGASASGSDVPFDGWLTFSQLVLTMDFDLSAPSTQVWTVNDTGIGFDLANSSPRPDSLVACFPVTPTGLVASPDLSPAEETPSGISPQDLGYLSISAPLDQVPMVPPWYGLVLSLDLGSLGALAGSSGLKAEILAAWMVSPDDGTLPVYLGLKLPGTPTRSGSFPLQGVLKLGFKNFVFSTYEQDGKRAYLLKLSRFALSVLGFSFPPGNLDISLFGGPQGRSTGQLGWLAAYVDPKAKPKLSHEPPSPQVLAPRRKRLGRLEGR